MIPKILHQTAPSNRSNWHPLWHKCQESWLTNFPDFEYKLWLDEDIDQLVEQHFPQYWPMYNEFQVHIMKIDFVRFCFMYKYGGIYADMDFYCYSNFYDDIGGEVCLVENPFGNDPIENSLMCSVPQHGFWIECMDLVKDRYEFFKRKYPNRLQDSINICLDSDKGMQLRPYLVLNITGPNLISSSYRMTRYEIFSLPGRFYNNNDASYHPSYKTKHLHTGLWGKESIDVFFSNEKHQQTLRNISIKNYDFYTDYSQGKYLTEDYLDIDKNNADDKLPGLDKYSYD